MNFCDLMVPCGAKIIACGTNFRILMSNKPEQELYMPPHSQVRIIHAWEKAERDSKQSTPIKAKPHLWEIQNDNNSVHQHGKVKENTYSQPKGPRRSGGGGWTKVPARDNSSRKSDLIDNRLGPKPDANRESAKSIQKTLSSDLINDRLGSKTPEDGRKSEGSASPSNPKVWDRSSRRWILSPVQNNMPHQSRKENPATEPENKSSKSVIKKNFEPPKEKIEEKQDQGPVSIETLKKKYITNVPIDWADM